MKKTDLKSVITIMVVSTLCLTTVGTLIFSLFTGNDTLFTATFALFGAQVGSIVTYYFTRKTPDGTDMQ